MALATLRPLAAVADAEFFSLQVGPAAAQIAEQWPAGGIRDIAAGFDDTAAAMISLDLIVSVDSALAHLAGALARPVWVLLASVPDWRWGAAGDESIWYPTMRLFRQSRPGEWAPVVDRATEELRAGRLLPCAGPITA
jgi:ADP-heptose:LPS heptosyltransferase